MHRGAPASHLWLGGEEGAGHSVHVLRADVDADVVEAHLMQVERARWRADVTLTGIRRKCYGVFQVTPGQVVTDGAVHVMLG